MPLLRPKPNSLPQHWSKDFVEHLRTVHFALLTVSLGLILLLASRPYDSRAAAKQLGDVMKICEDLASVRGQHTMDIDLSNGPVERFLIRPHIRSQGYAYETELSGSKGLIVHTLQPSSKTLQFRMQYPPAYVCDPRRGVYVHISTLRDVGRISDFATLWDHVPIPVDIVDSLSTTGEVRDGRSIISKMTIVGRTETPDQQAIDLGLREIRCPIESSKGQMIEVQGLDADHSYHFPVGGIYRVIKQQSDVRYQRSGVRSFEQAFPDLAIVAENSEDDAFATVHATLDKEISKNDESFEAFGLRFSGGQVTRWGLMILIGVQLYMVIYLKRLWKKLKSGDPGWDVPWMAMDQSLLARLMLLVSVVLLPSIAASFAAFRADQHYSFDIPWWDLVDVVRVLPFKDRLTYILMPLGSSLSIVLGILCWRYRPKMSEPSPEVLEDHGSGI